MTLASSRRLCKLAAFRTFGERSVTRGWALPDWSDRGFPADALAVAFVAVLLVLKTGFPGLGAWSTRSTERRIPRANR